MRGRERPDWERYALELAKTAAIRSEDPYVQVGACLLRADHSVAAVGYNGPPPGVDVDWSDRDNRRSRMVHAEANALRYVLPGTVTLLAATMMPCIECLKTAASYGIERIVYAEQYENPSAYDEALTQSVALEFNIDLEHLP